MKLQFWKQNIKFRLEKYIKNNPSIPEKKHLFWKRGLDSGNEGYIHEVYLEPSPILTMKFFFKNN